MIQCTKCKETKLKTEFPPSKTKKNGLKSWCRSCANKQTQLTRHKDYEKHRLRNRNYSLQRNYGITHEDYLMMFNKQNKKCACCNKEFDKLVVDHNHTTGVVRELLCNPCNTALGLLNEDVTVMQNMSNYVRKHNGIL